MASEELGTAIADLNKPVEKPRAGLRARLGRIFAPLVVIAAKAKTLLVILPKAKIMLTAGTMLVSVVAYSLIWGWEFAAGFVLILLVHEMGHVVQLRREGVQASAPVFIPFMGAVIGAKTLGDNALAEARVGLAGPLLGSLAAAAILAPLWFLTHSHLVLALAFTAAFLNVFQLIPMPPLDGSRAMSALSPKLWFVGLLMVIALLFIYPSPILILILIIGGLEASKRWKTRKTPEAQRYYKIAARHRVAVAAVYIGLILTLGAAMAITYVPHSL